jgi:tetratricopeptide (TPR) repeat protein
LQTELLESLGRHEEARATRTAAPPTGALTPRGLYLEGCDRMFHGGYLAALPLLEQAVRREPGLFAAWYALGDCRLTLGRYEGAVAAFNSVVALQPKFAFGYFNRGLAELKLGRPDLAEPDLDEALGLAPDLVGAYLNRALARRLKALTGKPRERKKLLRAALDDLSRALELDPQCTRAWFMRARLRQEAGDPDGAKADQQRGLTLPSGDEDGYIARGVARLEGGDVKGALVDFNALLKRNPRSYPALSNRAYILAEKQGRLKEAVAVLDRGVEYYPDLAELRISRAVYQARLGRRHEALDDVRKTLLRDTRALYLYQAAGVHSLLSQATDDDHHREGLRLFASSLRGGFNRLGEAEKDPDTANLRRDLEYSRLLRAARKLATAPAAPGGP